MIIFLNSSFEKKPHRVRGKTVEIYSRYCVSAFRSTRVRKESSNIIPAFFISKKNSSERRDVKCAPGDFVTGSRTGEVKPGRERSEALYGIPGTPLIISLFFKRGVRGVYPKTSLALPVFIYFLFLTRLQTSTRLERGIL